MSEQIDLTDYTGSESDQGWTEKQLGDIFNSIYSGGTPKRGVDEYYEGKIPFVKIEDLNRQQGEGVSTAEEHITEYAIEDTTVRAFESGTLLLTIYGSLAETAIVDSKVATNQGILGLWDAPDDNIVFIRYAIDDTQPKLASLSRQTTQANLGKGIVKKHRISVPTLEEQRKIATILHNVDQAIQKTETISRKLSTIRQGLRQDIFTGQTTDRTTKTTRTGPISVEIPQHWEIKKLGNFVDKFVGGATLSKDEFTDSGVCVLPKKAVNESGIASVDHDERQYTSEERAHANQTNIVDSNYLITALRDLNADAPSIGRIVKIDRESDYPNGDRYLLAQGVHGLKTSTGISDDYLIELSNSGWYRRYVKSISVGSTQIHIRNDEFLGIEIPVPPQEEQEEIATQLRGIVRLQSKERNYRKQLQRLKQGLMQDLLSGTVRTTDTNIDVPDEVAQHG